MFCLGKWADILILQVHSVPACPLSWGRDGTQDLYRPDCGRTRKHLVLMPLCTPRSVLFPVPCVIWEGQSHLSYIPERWRNHGISPSPSSLIFWPRIFFTVFFLLNVDILRWKPAAGGTVGRRKICGSLAEGLLVGVSFPSLFWWIKLLQNG